MKARLLAAAMGAATVLGGGNAFAADLGGNCCADLEERIAELEATTARKGNRKVSLTITGWVSSQLYWFDDGVESNVYVVDNNNDLSSNVKFTGSAQISPGWKAGYSLWIYTNGPSSADANDLGYDGTDLLGASRGWGLNVENSYWFIQSDTLGKLSVGKQSLAADNAALGTDFSGTLFPANGVTFDGSGLHIARNGAYVDAQVPGAPPALALGPGGNNANTWWLAGFWCNHAAGGIATDCAGGRLNGVRYDTPTYAGFTLGASWGEDDYWDVALRYSGEFSGFKLAFATAYSESTDATFNTGFGDTQYFQIGGMIKHLASGLWIHGTYGKGFLDDMPVALPDSDEGIYLKAGWTSKFHTLGNTHFYGEYGQHNDMFIRGLQIDAGAGYESVVGSEATRWGLGVVQEIDAAAMSLWAKWRHHELDTDLATSGNVSFEDVDMFLAGAVIFY